MRKLPLAILLGAVLVFSSCKNNEKTTDVTDAAEVTEAAVTEATNLTDTAMETTSNIIGGIWRLIELNGQAVEETINGKVPFIQLQEEESRYTASAGCNVLAGSYELKAEQLRIRFTQGISTMMACENMELEAELSKVLEAVDNFTENEGILSLNKARMAPLARFKLITE